MSDPFRETPKKSRSSRHSKPGEPLDQIDRLDGSGQFGSATFHHDGPFDAVRPHRNRSNSAIKPAPLDAFPIDGANNQLLSVMSAHNTANITSDNDPTRILLTNADNEAFNDFNQAADPEKSSPKVTYTSIKTSPGTNPYSI
ncbi:Pal1-domain-containing protein, partial [Nadsonia fulvescens var. elongata DSM 6958]